MEEIFDDRVLDDLCDVRTSGFESNYLKKYGVPEELKQKEQIEQEMIELIKKLVVDSESQKQIIEKFQNFKEIMVSEICFWHKPYYKMGYVDGISSKEDINDIKEKFN